MAIPETVGKRIKECRKGARLTQEKLAEMVNISPTYLSEIETGHKKAGREVMCNIAKALEVSLDYLMFAQEEHTKDFNPLEWKVLLEGCSRYEKNVLFDIARSTKEVLRKNRKWLNS